MGPSRLARFAFAAVVLGACEPQGIGEQEPPADAIRVRVYTNGGERFPEDVRWRFQSVGVPNQDGVVTWIPEATCIVLRPNWTLRVTTVQGGGEALVDAMSNSREFSNESPLDLAITRLPTGEVTVTEGLPGWWSGPPIRCASS